MSEDQDTSADKNFRSAYYKSLGFRGSEKSIAHLEQLLKAEIFDVKKLKAYCLKHTLTVYYRPLVWKIILSVIPVFTDKDTCSFIHEQKSTQFQDLKHVLQVMGRLEHVGVAVPRSSDREISSSKPRYSPTSPLTSSEHTTYPPSPLLSTSHSPLSPAQTHQEPSTDSMSTTLSSPTSQTRQEPQPSPDMLPKSLSSSSSTHVHQEQHKTLNQSHCTPRDFVVIFLLENNRLLSSAVNQMKQEEQLSKGKRNRWWPKPFVRAYTNKPEQYQPFLLALGVWTNETNLIAIAEAFFLLFKGEAEDGIYWIFSNFVKKLESHLIAKEEMLQSFGQILEDVDCALLEHIKDLEAYEEHTVPIKRWFDQCYARDLPESCIESIWDRVIGGSCMILVYLAVAIFLSFKRKIFGFSSFGQLQHLLDNIPKDNFHLIVTKAIELWDSQGNPLLPSNVKIESSPSHELYEIEDYS